MRLDRRRRAEAVWALFGRPEGREAWDGALLLSELAASFIEDPGQIVLGDE